MPNRRPTTYTLKAWTGRAVDGLPDLVEQVRLFGEQVLPRLVPTMAG